MAMPPVTAFSAPSQAQIGGGAKVKVERADEAEIQAIANKIIEQNRATEAANKAKQAAQAANVARLVQSGIPAGSIQNYLIRTPNASAADKSDVQPVEVSAKKSDAKSSEPAIDEETQKGHFGWETILKTHFPYVLRRGQKYSSVRIIDSKVLFHYLSVLRPEIYTCTTIRSEYMTEAEARMFNEINTKHCDSTYGNVLFTNHDLLVKVTDVCEFYRFLDMCVNKLCNDRSQPGDRCGFVRINGESVVPYTISGPSQFVPLFYFEGETDTLKLKAEKLGGWDLSYLKFCCKVQGIRNELFASETCSVISLDDIKSYFPPGTIFEDYWPTKGVDKSSLIDPTKSQLKGAVRSGAWTIQPKEPPPPLPKVVPKPVIPATPVAQVTNGWNGLMGGQSQYQTSSVVQQQQQQQQQQFNRMGQTSMIQNNLYSIGGLIYNTQSSQNGQTTSYYNQVHSMPTGATPQPPPLVRTTTTSTMNLTANLRPSPAYPATTTRQATTTNLITSTGRNTSILLNQANSGSTAAALLAAQMLHSQNQQQLSRQQSSQQQILQQQQQQQQQQLQQQQQQQQRLRLQQQIQYQQVQQQRTQLQQPTVQRVNNNMAQLTQRLLQQNNSSQLQIQLQQQQAAAALRQQAAAANKQHTTPPPLVPTNGLRTVDSQKLTTIPEVTIPPGNSHAPYKVQKALVEDVLTPCINSKPYHNSELLMTMPDLVSIFFPNTQLHNCRKVLQEVLNIELFKGNTLQMRALMEAGKCSSLNETLPLIQVRDVMKFYPQISYILKVKSSEMGNASKRQRVS
ncbi:uncharacterized protein LOC132199161 [Neocloeon triangulifer]|uniref:uncharacterized protein LOC132199161 n=1 Tax=Neocloeon triangulifer TaxID=2078957 RepID=UPI00286F83F5|nr:uncharacterized protein LOC132199161 [Neocloeon triangulifer]XP_059479672.1 uncharacterized protein LOC132199161 [Neocloeon triangulifer]